MGDELGVVVLGCGYWGINYVRVFDEIPGARVVAVCDQRPERLREVGRRFPGARLTTEVDEALAFDGVDAAVVATEATSHHDVARRCLRAGKHVLVEKPIATSVAAADDLIACAEEAGRILMVGHTFLYNAALRTMKEYVRTGDIGQVYYLYARRTNLGPIRRDVNAIWDLAPHDIAAFNYLLDRAPVWVSAVGARLLRNQREDVGFIALGYPGGEIGHVHVSWADPHKVREIVVVGSDQRVVFNDLHAMEPVRVFEKGVSPADEGNDNAFDEYRLVMRDGAVISPKIEASEPLKNQCCHFLDCITGGRRPLSGGWEGRDVIRVLEAIDASVGRKGEPIEVG